MCSLSELVPVRELKNYQRSRKAEEKKGGKSLTSRKYEKYSRSCRKSYVFKPGGVYKQAKQCLTLNSKPTSLVGFCIYNIYIYIAYTSDWFPYLGISYTIHLRTKQDGVQFCLSYERRTSFK